MTEGQNPGLTGDVENRIHERLAMELGVAKERVVAAIQLLDEGNTIPFIARYRKERTGELDETQLRSIDERLRALRALEARRQEIAARLGEQGNLTDELRDRIAKAETLQQLEDVYRPFRPKRRTRASVAREKGLEKLADAILFGVIDSPGETAQSIRAYAQSFVDPDKDVKAVEDALAGACDIVAEVTTDDPDIRELARQTTWRLGRLRSQSVEKEGEDTGEFRTYADFEQRLSAVRPHQVLAINRGEQREALRVRVDVDATRVLSDIQRRVDQKWGRSRRTARTLPDAAELRKEAVEDGYRRLLAPSIEREIRSELTARAEEQAVQVFGRNLRQRLLVPPSPRGVIVGIDPGLRTGCKVAVIGPTGEVLRTATIFPHAPQNRRSEAIEALVRLIEETSAEMIAIGDGTASRETEHVAADLIKRCPNVKYTVVSEAGASVYSASPLAVAELPDLDVSMRGAVSIARRLLDPLAELVKIDPKSIGVGMYQHDVDQKRLAEVLDAVVESCVNFVGVELNTASEALLRHVAGLSSTQAKAIVRYRQSAGRFRSRSELLDVAGIGAKTFEQCAGFLRIAGGDDPLDNTPVHPESYRQARSILQAAGFDTSDLVDASKIERIRERLGELDVESLAKEMGAGVPTVRDIVLALARPGRDPREDLPPPIYRSDVLRMEDLQPGMVLSGSVSNVVDFGAFVDIGVKKAGLVHVSQMGQGYTASPYERLSVGDIVDVQVLEVDHERGRISLALL